MANRTHLRTRFGFQLFTLHLLCVFLTVNINCGMTLWCHTSGLPWMMANSESFPCARHSSTLHIGHLILTITQTGIHYYYYPILEIRTQRLRESIWRMSHLEPKHGYFLEVPNVWLELESCRKPLFPSYTHTRHSLSPILHFIFFKALIVSCKFCMRFPVCEFSTFSPGKEAPEGLNLF